eukprot:snap_masked-scaffold_4-processed-gene-5.20-mRNA-1 protein AED:1.00 eAED:1.00 QI:0/-1/0/0/-1/1/1/0/88
MHMQCVKPVLTSLESWCKSMSADTLTAFRRSVYKTMFQTFVPLSSLVLFVKDLFMNLPDSTKQNSLEKYDKEGYSVLSIYSEKFYYLT